MCFGLLHLVPEDERGRQLPVKVTLFGGVMGGVLPAVANQVHQSMEEAMKKVK